ncbi:arylsulfatase [Desulfoluna spongiiphila]|uniref:Arylsulfatase n=1 Tax=Desulfoluna spongiiphila TaxID=419481 RepID=A0A1G5IMD1_9BACT|nr:arylsulfatase [Desulfoluna spongiiphila]SCY76880.1 arylsulfatase [Desulfoluna spongiiphila]VVS90978.1 alkaline phosphatase-like alpha/beta/alpha [Desulfoluna spongiiphila]
MHYQTRKLFSLLIASFLALLILPYSALAEKKQPNILIILSDDMGWADVGAFGSEIKTPNIDTFAKEGVRFTNFYTNPMCTPTRATLMSGVDHHVAGAGTMNLFTAPNQQGKVGYEGWLREGFKTLGDVMRKAGYATYVTGKWDLGRFPELIPRARGFDRDFVMLDSHGSHYDMTNLYTDNPKLMFTEDGKYLKKLPRGYYSSKTYTDKMISFIEDGRKTGKPFFAYLAYQAPHDPHHVDEPWRSMYQEVYDKGWTHFHRERFKAQHELGLLPEEVELAERYWFLPDSDVLAPITKAMLGRHMELYAGMMTNMDHHIGRVIQYLKDIGEYENTVVIFFGDNGPEGNNTFEAITAPGLSNNIFRARNWSQEHHINVLGTPRSYPEYGAGWAQISTTPFFGHKSFPSEGGIRNALIVKMPDSKHEAGSIRHDFMHVSDIMPTLAELTGQDVPNGGTSGRSWLGMLKDPDKTVRGPDDWVGWEIMGAMGLRKGNWKILNNWRPYGTREWQLFDLESDWAERHDLAEEKPDVLKELVALYEDEYMPKNNIILPNRALSESLWWNKPLRFPMYDNYPPGLYRKQYIPPTDMLADPKD